MLGLHWLDMFVILAYFGVLVLIGLVISVRIKNEEDFFMGGRSLGRVLQMFMNFGMATSTEHIVGAARETFRQGLAGVWINLFVLFIQWHSYRFRIVKNDALIEIRVDKKAAIFQLISGTEVLIKVYGTDYIIKSGGIKIPLQPVVKSC